MTETVSIFNPLGSHASSCGYCSPPGERSADKSSFSFGLQPEQLSCNVYQRMIDRGWRRSGTYCYKPDLRRSCCPQYTIKLDVLQFNPSKTHRKLISRWNRFVLQSPLDDASARDVSASSPRSREIQTGSKARSPFSFIRDMHASEASSTTGVVATHDFSAVLEPSSYTDEKFALYVRYQKDIHHEDVKMPDGFTRFLVDSPLSKKRIEYISDPPEHLPLEYGSYHQMYRLDGRLIAIGVLDILPSCVSSVYFMYDKTWERFSMGKLSALREAALAREINEAGVKSMRYLYMGFYIHSCSKMRYKGEYSPSYLADPETHEWYPLEQCIPLLERNRYACFSNPAHSIQGLPPAQASDGGGDVNSRDLQGVLLLEPAAGSELRIVPLLTSLSWRHPRAKRILKGAISNLGVELSREVVFSMM